MKRIVIALVLFLSALPAIGAEMPLVVALLHGVPPIACSTYTADLSNDGCQSAPAGLMMDSGVFTNYLQSGQSFVATSGFSNTTSSHPPPYNVAGVDFGLGQTKATGLLSDVRSAFSTGTSGTVGVPHGCFYYAFSTLPPWYVSGVTPPTNLPTAWDPIIGNGYPAMIACHIDSTSGNLSYTDLNFSGVNGHGATMFYVDPVSTNDLSITDFRFENTAETSANLTNGGAGGHDTLMGSDGAYKINVTLQNGTFIGHAYDSCCTYPGVGGQSGPPWYTADAGGVGFSTTKTFNFLYNWSQEHPGQFMKSGGGHTYGGISSWSGDGTTVTMNINGGAAPAAGARFSITGKMFSQAAGYTVATSNNTSQFTFLGGDQPATVTAGALAGSTETLTYTSWNNAQNFSVGAQVIVSGVTSSTSSTNWNGTFTVTAVGGSSGAWTVAFTNGSATGSYSSGGAATTNNGDVIASEGTANIEWNYFRDDQPFVFEGHGEISDACCYLLDLYNHNTQIATKNMGGTWDACINSGNANGGLVTVTTTLNGNVCIVNAVGGGSTGGLINATGTVSAGIFTVASGGPVYQGSNSNFSQSQWAVFALGPKISGNGGVGSQFYTSCGVGAIGTSVVCPVGPYGNNAAALQNTTETSITGSPQISGAVAGLFYDAGHGQFDTINLSLNYLGASLIGHWNGSGGGIFNRASDVTCTNTTNWGSSGTANVIMELGTAATNAYLSPGGGC